jgi:hypothetical protein
MPSAKSLIDALRKHTRTKTDLIDQLVTKREIRTGRSDRAVAILIAIQLEEALHQALLGWLRPLSKTEHNQIFGATAPLSGFAARIRMSYAMGVIGSKTRDELNVIREVRNAFAHSGRELSFDTPEVRNACAFLSAAYWQMGGQEARRGRKVPGRDARDRYHAAAENIIFRLQVREPPDQGPEWDWMP